MGLQTDMSHISQLDGRYTVTVQDPIYVNLGGDWRSADNINSYKI